MRRFGDCKDKATLLVTLLRSLGIDADLVLLRTRRGGTIESEPASLAVFDHAIAYVPTLDLYIDGTAEFSGIGELPAPDQDAMALRVSAHEVKLVRTPVQMAAANRTQRRWKVDLRQDGSAHIAEDVTVAGQSAHEWREHYQTPGERKERYAKVWNGRFAGAVLEEIAMDVGDRNQPALVHGLIHVPRMGEPRDQGEVHLPTSSREADYTRTYTRLGERHWPLLLGFPWRHEEVIRYVLPSRARVLRLPAARNIETPFGAYTMVVQTSPDGRELTFQSSLVVEKNRIEAFDYAAFRAFFRDIDAALAERLVVRLETTL